MAGRRFRQVAERLPWHVCVAVFAIGCVYQPRPPDPNKWGGAPYDIGWVKESSYIDVYHEKGIARIEGENMRELQAHAEGPFNLDFAPGGRSYGFVRDAGGEIMYVFRRKKEGGVQRIGRIYFDSAQLGAPRYATPFARALKKILPRLKYKPYSQID